MPVRHHGRPRGSCDKGRRVFIIRRLRGWRHRRGHSAKGRPADKAHHLKKFENCFRFYTSHTSIILHDPENQRFQVVIANETGFAMLASYLPFLLRKTHRKMWYLP